jgi:hypothetical protein
MDFDVRKTDSSGYYIVDFENHYIVADDDPDRALSAMDTFIREAQVAREGLLELISNES